MGKNGTLIVGLGIFAVVFVFFGGFLLIGVAGSLASLGGGGKGNEDTAGSVSCGNIETVDKLEGTSPPYENTKLGHEDHLTDTHPTHFEGPDSDPLKFVGAGAYAPHTTDQEHWYFNEYWPLANNYSYEKFAHKKLLIQSKETDKCVVVSVEEAGPATWVTDRDGIGSGAPPEVFRALGLKNLEAAYDKDPKSDKNRITAKFVKDQKDTPLGPTK